MDQQYQDREREGEREQGRGRERGANKQPLIAQFFNLNSRVCLAAAGGGGAGRSDGNKAE